MKILVIILLTVLACGHISALKTSVIDKQIKCSAAVIFKTLKRSLRCNMKLVNAEFKQVANSFDNFNQTVSKRFVKFLKNHDVGIMESFYDALTESLSASNNAIINSFNEEIITQNATQILEIVFNILYKDIAKRTSTFKTFVDYQDCKRCFIRKFQTHITKFTTIIKKMVTKTLREGTKQFTGAMTNLETFLGNMSNQTVKVIDDCVKNKVDMRTCIDNFILENGVTILDEVNMGATISYKLFDISIGLRDQQAIIADLIVQKFQDIYTDTNFCYPDD